MFLFVVRFLCFLLLSTLPWLQLTPCFTDKSIILTVLAGRPGKAVPSRAVRSRVRQKLVGIVGSGRVYLTQPDLTRPVMVGKSPFPTRPMIV